MAALTGTTSTFSQVGIREDLTDRIYDISPTDTPFMTSIARVDARGTKHEWQTDALAAASATNRQIEGDDAAFTTAGATTRLHNFCQISRKTVIVSGSMRQADAAGRAEEMGYQIAKQGRELRRDMESSLTQNNIASAGGTATARSLASLESWIATNRVIPTTINTTGTTPGATSGTVSTAPTDGTQSAFAKALLDTAVAAAWSAGGSPNTILVGPFNKRQLSTFTGISTLQTNAPLNQDVALIAGADLYKSDFGVLRVVPDRFSRDRTVTIYDPDFWAVAFYRPIRMEPLAKTGDADKAMLITEYTLEARNEKSAAKVQDVTTS